MQGEGLWVGVLSSGRCALQTAAGATAQGASGDIFLGFGTVALLPEGPCHLLAARLTGLAPDEVVRALPGPCFAGGAACPGAAELLARLHAEPEAAQDGAAAYALLCAVAQADQPVRLLPPLVAEALAAIKENYMALYGVEELSSQLGVSKCHLVRVFTAELGISPGKLLTRTRVEAAKRLLESGEYNLEVVASLCGFSGANYLCRVFKRETGVTPAVWRQTAAPGRGRAVIRDEVYV